MLVMENTNPVMDIAAPPAPKPPVADSKPEVAKELTTKPETKSDDKTKKPVATVQTKPKSPNHGVGMAIFATVVIVLGLGAIAAYAWLKQNS